MTKLNVFFVVSFLSLSSFVNVADLDISQFINDRNCDQVLNKKFYRICYDYRAKGAKYVGYTLKANEVNAGNIKKRPRFYPDKSIPA